jgi:hypothetical protein
MDDKRPAWHAAVLAVVFVGSLLVYDWLPNQPLRLLALVAAGAALLLATGLPTCRLRNRVLRPESCYARRLRVISRSHVNWKPLLGERSSDAQARLHLAQLTLLGLQHASVSVNEKLQLAQGAYLTFPGWSLHRVPLEGRHEALVSEPAEPIWSGGRWHVAVEIVSPGVGHRFRVDAELRPRWLGTVCEVLAIAERGGE